MENKNEINGSRPYFIIPDDVFPCGDLSPEDKKIFATLWENCKPKFKNSLPGTVMYYGTSGTVESEYDFEEAYSGAKFPHSLGIHFIKEAAEYLEKKKTNFTNDLLF